MPLETLNATGETHGTIREKINGNFAKTNPGLLSGRKFDRAVFEGDSITAGTPQPNPNDLNDFEYGQWQPTWADSIQGMTAFSDSATYENAAVSGSTGGTMIARYASSVEPYKPSSLNERVALIGMIGVNDIILDQLTSVNLDVWFASLETYWTQAKSDGFYLVWIAPLMSSQNKVMFKEIRKKILESSIPDQVIDGVQFVNYHSENGLYESDGLHITKRAGRLFAERLNAMLISGESSALAPYYSHANGTYSNHSKAEQSVDDGSQFDYLLRISLGDFSDKQSGLFAITKGNGQIAYGSSSGSVLITSPSGKGIDFAISVSSSAIQEVAWRIKSNGVLQQSKLGSGGSFSNKNNYSTGIMPYSNQVYSGCVAGDLAHVAPSGEDIVWATAETSSLNQAQYMRLRANGDLVLYKIREFADDAAADADATLTSGSFYKVTGNRVVYQKP